MSRGHSRSVYCRHLVTREASTALTFTRTSEKTCATAVVFASLNIKRDLPLNVPVTIDIPRPKRGELAFACGMNMVSGTVVVQ